MDNLQDFIAHLKNKQQLINVTDPLSVYLELTALQQKVLQNQGPALLCENVYDRHGNRYKYPVLINLFGHKQRFQLALEKNDDELKELAHFLAFLRNPRPPKNLKDAWNYLPIVQKVLKMSPNIVKKAPVQEVQYQGSEVNLDDLPIQWCWPNEPAPLITWGVAITKGPSSDEVDDYNLGIYRMQKLTQDRLIMRWLHHRGGAQQFKRWQLANPNQDMPCAVAIGMDPKLLLAAVMPLPDNLSEYKFAGLLKNKKINLVKAITSDILVPADAEIILEGTIDANEVAPEGPYGDHTGYYNDVEEFPVFKIKAITMRSNAVYLSTYTSRPPDEPSILGECLNDILIPLLQQQFPEIVDFYLVPDACSYRIAYVSIKKAYPGHAKRIMFGIWSYLRQFMYTKYIVIFDEDINIRSSADVIWALSTNIDPQRDMTIVANTPIDYLDFASPVSGLGSKIGIDATHKVYPETSRTWGVKINMDSDVSAKIDDLYHKLMQ